MTALIQLATLLAVMGTGVVYGTDVFCAIAQRPALAQVSDAALTTVMGNLHRYADVRMRVPGIIGLLFALVATVLAAASGLAAAAVLAGAAFVLLVVWMVVYVRVSAPINARLIAAADAGETPSDARALQDRWDRVIVLRATLQGTALLALALTLALVGR